MKRYPLLVSILLSVVLSLLGIPALWRWAAPQYHMAGTALIAAVALLILAIGTFLHGMKRRKKERRWANLVAFSLFFLILACCAVYLVALYLNQ